MVLGKEISTEDPAIRLSDSVFKSVNSTKNFFSNWGTLKHEVPQGSILGTVFVAYITDPPPRIYSVSEPVLFTYDTNVIISSINFEDFCSVSNLVLSLRIKWFAANNLVVNLDKMNIFRFITQNHILHYILVIKKSIWKKH